MKNLAIAAAIVFAASAVQATTFVVPTDDQLFQKSEAVVIGTVLGSHSLIVDDGTLMTATDVRIEQVIKGPIATGELISAEAPGGRIGSLVREVHGAPKYEPGNRVLLFLFQWQPGRWATVDLTMGKFSMETDVRGRRVAVRDDADITGWNSDLTPYISKRRDAGAFLQYLRQLARGNRPRTDYLVESVPLVEKATLEQGTVTTNATLPGIAPDAVVPPATNYLMTQGGTNFRWSIWDSSPGTAVVFRSYQFGPTVSGADTAVAAATAAWTNDCGSKINLAFGGASLKSPPNGLGPSDGENTVRWEVALSGINPFSCSANSWSGVLGLGGPNGTGGTHQYEGTTYYSITEGDVDMNKGIATCSALPQSLKNAAVTHEIGHTLNFRHSDKNGADNAACAAPLPCSSTALMTSTIPNGVDAVLQQWDIDATRATYPGGTCGGTVTAGKKGDFNGDGRDDLIWRNGITGANSIWFINNTTPTGGGSINAVGDTGWKIGGTGDFNRDGKTDILWHHQTLGTNTVWFMNGTTYLSQATLQSAGNLSMIPSAVGDFDGDGNVDIAWRNTSTGANTIWFMNGTTVQGQGTPPAVTDQTWQLAGAGDVNGDGKADLFWWNSASGSATVWLMSGATRTSQWFAGQVANVGWRVAAVGDFNGDGRYDIMWRNNSGSVAVWFLNGSAVLGGGFVGAVYDTSWDVAGPR